MQELSLISGFLTVLNNNGKDNYNKSLKSMKILPVIIMGSEFSLFLFHKMKI